MSSTLNSTPITADGIVTRLRSLIINKIPGVDINETKQKDIEVPLPTPFYFSIKGEKLKTSCQFSILNGHLVFKKKGRQTGSININLFYLQEHFTTLQGPDNDRKPGLLIFNDFIIIKVVLLNREDFISWKCELAKYCLQKNIFEKYKAAEIISESPKSRVFLGIEKE